MAYGPLEDVGGDGDARVGGIGDAPLASGVDCQPHTQELEWRRHLEMEAAASAGAALARCACLPPQMLPEAGGLAARKVIGIGER